MQLLILGLLAALAMVAHPANAPPASPSHQSLMNARLTTSSTAALLMNEPAPCTEVPADDASYCAYAVMGSEELLNVTRGTIEHGSMTIGLDLGRAASKTLLMTFDEYLHKLDADRRATFEDRLRSV